MIRQLRNRHRLAAVGMLLIAPTILVVAINARSGIPPSSVPEPLGARIAPAEGANRGRIHIGSTWFDIAAWSEESAHYMEITPVADSLTEAARRHPEIHGPDVLAYLSNERMGDLVDLDDAIVLGPMRGAMRVVFAVPAWPATPYLTLVSLARAEVLGSEPLPPPPEVVSGR